MPHIDDGTLHAWLDGAIDALAAAGALPDGMQPVDVAAHLEQCADCRARLDRERDVRERAGLVLRDAGPYRVHTPPLAATPQATRPRRAWLPMAWAASLLMAVGAGWWGSQIAREPRVASESASDSESQLQSMERNEAARASTPTELHAPITRPAAPGAAEPPPDVDAAALQAVGMRPPSAADRSAAAESLTSGDATDLRTRGASDVAAAPAGIEEHRLDTARSTPDRVAHTERPAQPTNTPAGADVMRGTPLGRAADAGPVAQAVPPPPQLLLRAPTSPLAMQETEHRSVVTFDGIAGFIANDSAGLLRWTPLNATSAMGLADAEIISAERTSEIGATITRLTQRLGTGDTVEVVSWTEQAISLDAVVVTGVPRDAQPARAPVPSREAAAAAQKSADSASAPSAPVRARSMGTHTHELLFTRPNGWVLVRAPSWLDADEIRARLGAVSVAPAAR